MLVSENLGPFGLDLANKLERTFFYPQILPGFLMLVVEEVILDFGVFLLAALSQWRNNQDK